MRFDERVYWNANAYGSALRVPARALQIGMVFVCIVTPFTNWMIPFAGRLFPRDIVWRY